MKAQPNKVPRSRSKQPAKQTATLEHGRTSVAETAERIAIEAERRSVMRGAMIAEAAYFLAERRGFAPGAELDDWLAAEAELERTPLTLS